MKTFQRTCGWLLILLSLLGLIQQDWLRGLLQIEKGIIASLFVLGLVCLAAANKGWISTWTWSIGIFFLLTGIAGFAYPEIVHYKVQPFEALLSLVLSTWGIYEALKARHPAVPTE